MERTLALVFTDDGELVLPLKVGPSVEIDKFTSKFNNADELRRVFSKEINEYIKNNYHRIQGLGNRKNGQIALYNGDCRVNMGVNKYCFDFSREKRLKVLYKKDMDIIDEVIKYEFARVYWKEQEQKYGNSYDRIRTTISYYERSRKNNPNLPTTDKIWKDYLNNLNQISFDLNNDIKEDEESKEKHIIINGNRYVISDEEQEQLDNDMFLNGDDIGLDFKIENVDEKHYSK